MNKGIVVHYKNKYPNGRVDMTENSIDVYCYQGVHRVALRKGGDGLIRDMGAELGAMDKHDMDPIPKNTRMFKLRADGNIGLDEQAAERKVVADKLEKDFKILSIAEYRKAGFEVDEKGNVIIPT